MPYYIGDVIKESKRLVIRTPEEFKKTGIDVQVKTHVESIDPQKGLLYLSDGRSLPYDFLVMATGADAIRLDIPGKDLEGVYVIRNLTDTLKMKSYLNEGSCKKAVLIGAGYIGMEMCEALRNLGSDVKVMDILPRPAYRWDPEFTKLIVEELGKNQVEFLPETKPLSIEKGKECRAQADYQQRRSGCGPGPHGRRHPSQYRAGQVHGDCHGRERRHQSGLPPKDIPRGSLGCWGLLRGL